MEKLNILWEKIDLKNTKNVCDNQSWIKRMKMGLSVLTLALYEYIDFRLLCLKKKKIMKMLITIPRLLLTLQNRFPWSERRTWEGTLVATDIWPWEWTSALEQIGRHLTFGRLLSQKEILLYSTLGWDISLIKKNLSCKYINDVLCILHPWLLRECGHLFVFWLIGFKEN